jgi:transcriptional regulator with XRE-family HTH domain
MPTTIDLHVGRRLRRRRRLMGMTQQQLADMVGIRFQQIQKYECGANRITASRLFELSAALSIPVQYFYDGLATPTAANEPPANDHDEIGPDILRQKETRELIRVYYKLGERPRRRLLDLAKALQEDASDAA